MRRSLRQARAAFAAAADAATSAARDAALAAWLAPLLESDGPIAGYVAHRGEPDILPLLSRAHAQGRTVALPIVGADRLMRFVAWHPRAALAAGPRGILQPEADGDEVEAAVVLAPLIGFDRRGTRLGQGGGHYDRWFAAHPQTSRVGIAWSIQEVDALPRDTWDMPLHAVATEKEWLRL